MRFSNPLTERFICDIIIKSEIKQPLFHGGNMNIVTVTLNPAFDMHCFCGDFCAYRENFAVVTELDAGGKGVNISRALSAADVKNRAVIAVGRKNGSEYLKALDAGNVNYTAVMTDGRIRENITVHTENAPETRISFGGFTADISLLPEIEKAIGKTDSDTTVTFSGKNPQGTAIQDIKALIKRVKSTGAKIVLDSSSFEVSDVLDIGAWLIKPNEEEIARYIGISEPSTAQIIDFALRAEKGGTENVMISLGKRGAILVCDEGVFSAQPPEIDAVSTIGAGDSSIAGFVKAASEGKNPEECLRTAVAFGSAACLTAGTKPPKKKNIEKLFSEIKTEKLSQRF